MYHATQLCESLYMGHYYLIVVSDLKSNWALRIAENLVDKRAGNSNSLVCASGISPSGHIHAGNLREVLTTEFVYKSLIDLDQQAEFIFSWDDFDRLRKVPFGLPDELSESIGKPYSEIGDPYGEYDSYASRFISPFKKALEEMGVNPRFIRQSEMYKSRQYDNKISFCLRNRRQLAKILARNMTQGMSLEEEENYFPISVYSRFTGKDNTTVLSFDGDSKISYFCRDTHKEDSIDFTKEHVVKLHWKIDWPMRWQYERVVFEPGGPDHASPGSSYDVSSQISRELFLFDPPTFQEYGFIRIQGQRRKMSSSSGNVITPDELLRIYSPEMIRWLYLRVAPNSPLDIGLDEAVIRTYSEYDQFLSGDGREILPLVKVNSKQTGKKNIPFRKILGLGEATAYNLDKIRSILKEDHETFDELSIEDRLVKSAYWSDNYDPESKSSLLTQPNDAYFGSLSDIEKNQIRQLCALISDKERYSRADLELLIYQIPKKDEMTEPEQKKAQRRFFMNAYQLLFGKDRGPRLPTYIWAMEDKRVIERLLQF